MLGEGNSHTKGGVGVVVMCVHVIGCVCIQTTVLYVNVRWGVLLVQEGVVQVRVGLKYSAHNIQSRFGMGVVRGVRRAGNRDVIHRERC